MSGMSSEAQISSSALMLMDVITGTSGYSAPAVLVTDHQSSQCEQKGFSNSFDLEEQLRMNDCYYDKKDWRACKTEVSC